MNKAAIEQDVQYVRASDVVATDMDGETVMMDVQKGSYFALSGTGPRIWEKLANPMRIGDLITSLGEEYDIDDVDDLEAVVNDFVAGLLDKGLLRPSD
ncbi:MAG: PqqD family peptide modification chaperone [Erythrobacter sp.]